MDTANRRRVIEGQKQGRLTSPRDPEAKQWRTNPIRDQISKHLKSVPSPGPRDNENARTLAGQVAIVTGGGRGIGRTTAQILADAGAAVAVVARSADQVQETVSMIEAAGGRAGAYIVDVTDEVAVREMVSAVEQQFGPVDLMVANAGVLGPLGRAWQTDSDAWWHCLEVNLRGPYLCAKAVLPGMVDRKRGRIIVVSSVGGLWPNVEASAYGISKCAVIRLAETLAAEAHEDGITVFSIHPGLVRTEISEEYMAEGKHGDMFREAFDTGTDASPENAAHLMLQLAEGKLDALSGCFFDISDDVDELIARAEAIQTDDLYRLRLRTLVD